MIKQGSRYRRESNRLDSALALKAVARHLFKVMTSLLFKGG